MKSIPLITILFFGVFTSCFGQQSPNWEKWNWLIGEWVGVGTGQPGQGGGYFSFKADLDNQILVRNSHTEFLSSGNRPAAIHNDLMIIYPGNQGAMPKAIYFDNEEHTINYLVSFAENSIILTSEKVPDVPVFRLTYTLLDPETVNTKFEISHDNVNFVPYIEGKSKKTK